MEHIYISSQGTMPIEAFSMMGVSTKRNDDNTIGMFGTGLKYGVARLLDKNIGISVTTGGKKITFGTKEIDVKGQSFNRVTYKIEGMKKARELGFSAEMGLQWTINDALREIVANAMDEGGMEISYTQPDCKGKTVFEIELKPEVKDYFDDINKWFILDRNPVFVTEGCRAYPKHREGTRIYMKKVLVFEDRDTESLYDYEFDKVHIDETRKAGLEGFRSQLTNMVMNMPEYAIKQVIDSFEKRNQYIEHKVSTYYYASDIERFSWNKNLSDTVILSMSNEWLTEKLAGHKRIVVPNNWEYLLRQNSIGLTPKDVLKESDIENLEEYVPSEYELLLFKTAKKFLEQAGYSFDGIEFHLYKSKDGTLGRAIDGDIWISDTAFRNGKKDMVDTILHEYLHIKSGKADETREFERYIISEIVKQLELKTGEIL